MRSFVFFLMIARNRMGAYEVHGMPSGHSQAFFYFMSYIAIFVILK